MVVAKKPSVKQNVAVVAKKKPSGHEALPCNKRPSSVSVMNHQSSSTSCSSADERVDVQPHWWLAEDVNSRTVEPSSFAIAVSAHLNGICSSSPQINPHRVQSLLYEAEDDYAHAHHMLNIDNCRANHVLQYMTHALQSSFWLRL